MLRENLRKAQKDDFAGSELVFIGKVVSIDTIAWEFEIEPLEIFKGNLTKTNLKSRLNVCSSFARNAGDLWLVYGTLEDQNLYISECGRSRSFDYPFTFRTGKITLPPPPMPNNNLIESALGHELAIAKAKQKAIRVLKKEIRKLRRWSARSYLP